MEQKQPKPRHPKKRAAKKKVEDLAKLLFYLGFDLAFALTKLPDTELVFRIQHRSGAYGTLGAMKEGNNANVVGIRQRF